MSLVDLVLPPSRGQQQQQQQPKETEKKEEVPLPTQKQKQPAPNSSSYIDHPSPKVQSRDSMDSAVYQEFYAPQSPEASSDNTIAPKKRNVMEDPPALPERSALRASRLLDNISQTKLDSQTATMSQSTPHDLYLSSEEEASSSADDFSDYDFDDDADVEDFDSSSEESQKSPVRRKSHEDTARVVSVIFSGRPSIIDVSTSKRSTSPASVDLRPRISIASNPESLIDTPRPSTSAASSPPKFHPPRSSSMMLPPTTRLSKQRPQFLNTDPFPNHGGYNIKGDEEAPRTPRTPTAVLKSVSRTFSLVKKRSRPLLNNLNNSVSSHSSSSGPTSTHHSGSSPDLHYLERSQTPQSLHSATEDPSTPPSSGEFVLHSESASRRDSSYAVPPPPPRTPMSPAGTMKGILAMARRRSIHIRAAAARV